MSLTSTMSGAEVITLLARYDSGVDLIAQASGRYRLRHSRGDSWEFPLQTGEVLFALCYVVPDLQTRISKEFPELREYVENRAPPFLALA
jgi:hypothetical protein